MVVVVLLLVVCVWVVPVAARALASATCKLKQLKVESPGSLKPWVAAGGREAIRITMFYLFICFGDLGICLFEEGSS